MSSLVEMQGSRPTQRLARGLVWGVFGAAVLVGLLIAVFGSIEIVADLVTGRTELTMVAEHALPSSAHGGSVAIVSGGYATADIVGTGFSSWVVTFTATSMIARLLTEVLLAAGVAALAWRAVRGGPFRQSVSVTFAVGGALLTLGAIISQAANVFATGLASEELDPPHSHFWLFAGRIDPTLIVVGLVLMLVGVVFNYAEKLQRDSDGLV